MVDTLLYVKRLMAAGVPREQAEAEVMVMTDIVHGDFATKQDLKDLAAATRQDVKDLGVELRGEMKDLGAELRGEMKDIKIELKADIFQLKTEIRSLEDRMTIKLGAMLVVGIGVLGAMIKLL